MPAILTRTLWLFANAIKNNDVSESADLVQNSKSSSETGTGTATQGGFPGCLLWRQNPRAPESFITRDAAQMFGIKTSTGLHRNRQFHRNKKFMGEQTACQFKKVCSRLLLGLNKQLGSGKFCLCLVILLGKDFFFWIVKKKLSLPEYSKLYLKSRDLFFFFFSQKRFLTKIQVTYICLSLGIWANPVSHFQNQN